MRKYQENDLIEPPTDQMGRKIQRGKDVFYSSAGFANKVCDEKKRNVCVTMPHPNIGKVDGRRRR